MDDVQWDARPWLLGTEGHTRVVVVVAFTEIPLERPNIATAAEADPPQDGSTSGSSPDSEVDAFPEETTLLASINDTREFVILAEALLSLHRQRKLHKPLLGSVVTTMHLLRPNPACDSITESFTCTLLPVPTALDAPQSIPLTLGDLLSPNIAIANSLNPDELILLPLVRVRAIVAKQLPKQESARSMDRAMGLRKKRAVWEELRSLAQNMRTKRKPDNEDVE